MATPNTTPSTIDLRRGLPEGLEMFDVIEDPRSGNATRHPFGSILFIALCAMLCGMDHCEDFVRFAKAREAWLKKWIALPGGIHRMPHRVCHTHFPGTRRKTCRHRQQDPARQPQD